MGRAILTLLCLWSFIMIVTPLSHKEVNKVTEYIRKKFNPAGTRQYAYVAVFTQAECNSFSHDSFQILGKENANDIADALNHDEKIYQGEQMVLATFRAMPDEHNIHSEYRLLFPEEGYKNSPVMNLLNKNKKDAACVFFYSLNSPCVGTCANMQRAQNIIQNLDVFEDFSNNNKVFVYSKLYEVDLRRQEKIWTGLGEVNKKMVVYRNFPNNCYECFHKEKNTFIYKGQCIN